jgi:uncharacterized membrane protein
MSTWTRKLLWLSSAVGLSGALARYATSPPQVPVHYGIDGAPDRFGSPLELLVVQIAAVGLGTLLFASLPAITRRIPIHFLNFPNKEYWLAEQRRDLTLVRLGRFSDAFGIAHNVLWILLIALLSPHSSAAPTQVLGLLIGAFLAFTVGWTIAFRMAYRLRGGSELPRA